jgi:hypothetical protein
MQVRPCSLCTCAHSFRERCRSCPYGASPESERGGAPPRRADAAETPLRSSSARSSIAGAFAWAAGARASGASHDDEAGDDDAAPLALTRAPSGALDAAYAALRPLSLSRAASGDSELLLPDNLLRSDSVIAKLVAEIPEEDWAEVEIIGWLYQFYISEKKDEVIGKVVASEVHIAESSALAAELLKRGTLKEKVFEVSLILHSDNGSAMKGSTMLATMQNLGVVPSFSRPRVSNDNAFAETLFRTAKYCPLWPSKPFESLEKAREWVATFVTWYNEEHRHSGIRFVTPDERHRGKAEELLQKRHHLYQVARERYPQRWSGQTRNWTIQNEVFLNPERSETVA